MAKRLKRLELAFGVATENSYFVLDVGPDQPTERETSPGDECWIENLLLAAAVAATIRIHRFAF